MATTSTGRTRRISHVVACAAVLALGVAACGGGGGGKTKETVDPAPKTEKAKKAPKFDKRVEYNLGYGAQFGGDRKEAEKHYRRAIKVDPKFGSALYNLAILVTPDDIDEAIRLYHRAIAVNEDDANSHFSLGLLLRQQGKTREGNTQVQLAVQLDPALAPQATAQGVPLK